MLGVGKLTPLLGVHRAGIGVGRDGGGVGISSVSAS